MWHRIYGEKRVNFGAFKATIISLWGMRAPISVRNLGNNMFQFIFHNIEEKEWILQGKSWNFDGQYLILKEWDPGTLAVTVPVLPANIGISAQVNESSPNVVVSVEHSGSLPTKDPLPLSCADLVERKPRVSLPSQGEKMQIHNKGLSSVIRVMTKEEVYTHASPQNHIAKTTHNLDD
ncbi:zinc ion binding [Striga asiatica]|uniref:Zinc ion binding n=1 Tax=Striga asiatica TaxID=4170 RepID=A0A5A7P931_STRAF|nr:zinc ion binding [Striga asiatica]